MKKYKNIDLLQSYSEYYKMIKNTFSKNYFLTKNNLLDASEVFNNSKNQYFVDTVHLGSKGQSKLAELIGKKILLDETTNKHIK